MRAPLGEIGDARREPVGMQAQAKHIDRRLQQRGRRSREQPRDGVVRRNERPMTVDRKRRIRFVALEDQIDRAARRLQRRIAQGPFCKDRRVSRRDQEHVALTQGYVEPFGQVEDHLARRLRSAGFDKAQVPRRDIGLAGEVELAHAPTPAPISQVIAQRSDRFHRRDDSASPRVPPITLDVIDFDHRL